MSCPGTGAPTRGWNPTSVLSARRSLLEVTICPNMSRCIGFHEATVPSAPWTDWCRLPLPAQPSYNSRWQHFVHYISSDNLFVSTEQSMLLLDTTTSECLMSFKDDLRMKFFLGQGRGVLLPCCMFFFKDVIFLSFYLSLLCCCCFWKLQCFIFSCFLLHRKM